MVMLLKEQMLKNFLYNIAGLKGTFTMRSRESECIEYIRKVVGNNKVLVSFRCMFFFSHNNVFTIKLFFYIVRILLVVVLIHLYVQRYFVKHLILIKLLQFILTMDLCAKTKVALLKNRLKKLALI